MNSATAIVQNFRAVRKAELTVSQIALIGATNAEGKTALLQAIGAALTRDAVGPFRLKRKEDAAALVHDGDKHAVAEVFAETGSVRMSWPDGQASDKGDTPPKASKIAVGLESLATAEPLRRAQILEEQLHTRPTREDLAKALPEVPENHIDRLWGMIEQDGWDPVHQQMIERRRTAGQEWHKVTGERIGSAKAKSWAPEGWRPGLDDVDEEELGRQVAAAKQAVEEAVAAKAVDVADRGRLEALGSDLPKREEDVHVTQEEKERTEKVFQAAQLIYQRLYRPPTERPLICPHCRGALILESSDLVTPVLKKYHAPDPEKVTEINAAIESAKEAMETARAARDEAVEPYAAADAAWREANQAQMTLLKYHPQTGSPQAVEAAETLRRQHLSEAENDLKIWRQMRDARLHARNWEAIWMAIEVLQPTGLRQRKLAAAIEAFNRDKLAPACAVAGWQTKRFGAFVPGIVAIDPIDLDVTYGGRPYSLISKSDRLKVDATLQIVFAQMDGSDLILIDNAEELKAIKQGEDDFVIGLNQLFKLLASINILTVIAVAWSAPSRPIVNARGEIERYEPAAHPWDRLPDLAEGGLGRTYWLEDGFLRPLGAMGTKEAA